jgi:Kef-type K+ transport system membrane component KefB
LGESVKHLAELGVIFLMFLAGLEIDLQEMLKTGRAAALAGTLGVVVPVLLGLGASWAFGYALNEAFFIGIVLSATSVRISAQIPRQTRRSIPIDRVSGTIMMLDPWIPNKQICGK